MKRCGMIVAVMMLVMPLAVRGGQNEGGCLILHANPSVAYTSDQTSYCGESGLSACSLAVVSVPADPETISLFHAIAAFPDSVNPDLAGVCFGVSYDSTKFVMVNDASCGDFENAMAAWPRPGSGTIVTWSTNISSNHLSEVYWFAGYCYSAGDSTLFSLIPHPELGGYFGDNQVPPQMDPISDYGALGFGMAGYRPCFGGGGGMQNGGPDGPGGSDGPVSDGGTEGPGSGDNPPGPDSLATECLSIWLDPSAIAIDHDQREAVPIGQVAYLDPDLEAAFVSSGAIDIAVQHPGVSPADTIALDHRRQPVRVPDLSGFYQVRFASAAAAAAAIDSLAAVGAVKTCQQIHAFEVSDVPNDPYVLGPWPEPCAGPTCLGAPQWHLINDGSRDGSNHCPRDIPGIDIHLAACDSIPGYADVIIGEVDTGVLDDHPDLDLIPLSDEEKHGLQTHPDDDWCIPHGTLMAGLAAATRNNYEGGSGVCGHCRVLDIESSRPYPYCDCANHSGECQVVGYADHVRYAATHFAHEDESTQLVLNLEFCGVASSPFHGNLSNDEVLALWFAYLQGVVQVAPGKDVAQPQTVPYWCAPGDLPFVLGVGGHTFDTRFWDLGTTCAWDGGGTAAGP